MYEPEFACDSIEDSVISCYIEEITPHHSEVTCDIKFLFEIQMS
jgi:hypothetical protein